jgi:predicted transposase YbfD/YdcC
MKKKVKKKVTKKKTTYKEYNNYFKFAKRVGILEEEELAALGWKCDNGNRICFSKLNQLIAFMDKLNAPSNAEKFIAGKKVKTKKRYHLATDLDAGELEDEYRRSNGISDEVSVFATQIVNRMAYVNRMDYYLCNGDDNEDIYLAEVEEM